MTKFYLPPGLPKEREVQDTNTTTQPGRPSEGGEKSGRSPPESPGASSLLLLLQQPLTPCVSKTEGSRRRPSGLLMVSEGERRRPAKPHHGIKTVRAMLKDFHMPGFWVLDLPFK